MPAAPAPMAVHAAPTHQSVGGVGAALWKRKFWILIPTLAALFASMAIVNLLPVRHSGEARVLLENRDTVYSRADKDNRATDPAIDAEAVASQVQIVMSKDLALKVIREMGLAKKAEFDPLASGLNPLKAFIMAIGLSSDPRLVPLEERVVETYFKRLLVFPQGKSRVISIEFQSEDANLAAAIANRIAEEYLKREEGAKSETSKVTSDWLDKAIAPLMTKVVAAEAKVEAFRSSKGLFVGANNLSMTNQQLTELNTQLSSARAQQADLQSRAKLIREALRLGKVFETSEINNNELVRRLLEQRASLKAQIAFDERTLLPGHPRMKELGAQLQDLEGQVRSAAERAARAFDNDARAAGARVQSVQAELNSQKKTATLSNDDEVQLKALERDATVLRDQLNSYRNKFLDAAARSSDITSPADARIISRAFAQNEPVFPKKLPIVLLATLGTMVVAMALIASSHLMARQTAFGGDDFVYGYPMPGAPYGLHPAMPVPPQLPTMRQPAASMPPFAAVQDQFAPPRAASSVRDPYPWEEKVAAEGGFRWPFGWGKKAQETPPASPVIPASLGMHNRQSEGPVFGAFGQAQQFGQVASFEAPIADARAPQAQAEAINPRPDMQAAEDIAHELAMMGYLGRGKVLVLHGTTRHVRSSLHAMRFGRRLARDGATLVIDLLGQQDLYKRVLGPNLPGLGAYLAGHASLGDVIHADPKSKLHIIPAGEALQHTVFGARVQGELIALVEALMHSYAHIIIDAGPAGGAGEMVADCADAFVLMTDRLEESPLLRATADRLEGLNGAQVFVVLDEGTHEKAPANDRAGPHHFGAA